MKVITRMLFALMGLATLLLPGCPPPPPVCFIAPPSQQPQVTPYFGRNGSIHVEEYNEVYLRYGDTITLQFPCPVAAPLHPPDGVTVKVEGDRAKVVATPSSRTRNATAKTQETTSPATIEITFPSPSFGFTVHPISPDQAIWPGDANADGYRNMLDMFPIVNAIKDGVSDPCLAGSNNCAGTPAQLGIPIADAVNSMQTLITRTPWGIPNIAWGEDTVDAMHADVNMDHIIDTLDILYLREVMEPMFLPEFLQSASNGLELTASLSATVMPEATPNLTTGKFNVSIPFDIALADPSTSNAIPNKIFGVAFTRPVAEPLPSRLISTSFDLDNNGLFPNTMHRSWAQKFWPGFSLSYPNSGCSDAEDRPLDVGLFRWDSLGAPISSNRCGLCMVNIEDILMPAGGSGSPIPITLVQHLVNGVVFAEDDNGQLQATTVECTTDNTTVPLDNWCNQPGVIILDGLEDDGGTPTFAPQAWQSPDIWNTHTNSAGEVIGSPQFSAQPVSGAKETAHVRVWNRSCQVLGNEREVSLYWAYGPLPMDGSSSFRLIGTKPIGTIPFMGSKVLDFEWVPNFSDFPCNSPMINLLAVVHPNGADPIEQIPGSMTLQDWVLTSNHVAMHNTLFISTSDESIGAPSACFKIPSGLNTAELWVEQIQDVTQACASNYGQLRIETTGGSVTSGTGFSLSDGQFLLGTHGYSGSLNNIGSASSFQVSFQQTEPVENAPALLAPVDFSYRIYLKQNGITLGSSFVQLRLLPGTTPSNAVMD
jgi:hypothetical protein